MSCPGGLVCESSRFPKHFRLSRYVVRPIPKDPPHVTPRWLRFANPEDVHTFRPEPMVWPVRRPEDLPRVMPRWLRFANP